MFKRYFPFICAILVSTADRAQSCSTPIHSFPYRETFENSDGGWLPGGTASDWIWGSPTRHLISSAGEGSKCWITGGLTNIGYNANENSWLKSPCFDFTSLVDPRISFWVFCETERVHDGANMQYSFNGIDWTVLGTENDSVCLRNFWFDMQIMRYLYNQQGWAGNLGFNNLLDTLNNACATGYGTGRWEPSFHDLRFLAGQPHVIFRFQFASSPYCNGYDGFAFDDIQIFETPPSDVNIAYTCRYDRKVDFRNISPCFTTSYWDFGDPASGPADTSTLPNPTHIFSSPGNYRVRLASDFFTGPRNANSINLTILDVNASIDQGVSCNGQQDAVLHAVGAGSSTGYNYSWNSNPVQTTDIIHVGAGLYTVTVTPASGQGCPDTAMLNVIEPATLKISPVITPQKCLMITGSIISNLSGGTAPYSYLWNTGDITPGLSNLPAGDYTMHAVDSKGCILDTGPIVVPYDNGNLKADLGRNRNICFTEVPTLLLQPGIFLSYLWQDNSTATSFIVTRPGDYSVAVSDLNGCIAKDTVHVSGMCDVYFPSVFTPNGDNKNDLFGPAGNDLDGISDYHLEVYNRYGQMVFISVDPYRKWDGQTGSKISGNESFTWFASFYINGRKDFRKGSVTLIK